MRRKNRRHLTDSSIIMLLISVIIILVCLQLITMLTVGDDYLMTLKTVGVSVLGSLIMVAIANIFWDFIMKKRLAEEVYHITKTSQNVQKSGLDYVYSSEELFDWRKNMLNAKKIKLAIVSGKTAVNILTSVKEQLKGKKIKLYVPDYSNDDILNEYDRKFSYKKGTTKRQIEECIAFFADCKATIYRYNGSFYNSYYSMDGFYYMSTFNHDKEKGKTPILIKANNIGFIGKYIEYDLDNIKNNSVKIYNKGTKKDEKVEK